MPLDLQARRALALSERLSVPALFVLMQVGSVPKGSRSRVFHLRWLRTPSTMAPLEKGRHSLDDALAELAAEGFLQRVGPSRFVCTAAGDLAKHCLNDLLAEAEVNGVIGPLKSDKLARMALLRRVLRLYVEGESWPAIRGAVRAER
jgi:hypothetical protein